MTSCIHLWAVAYGWMGEVTWCDQRKDNMERNYSIPRYRAFAVKYVCPTNHRGGRISIHDTRHNERVMIEYNSEGPTQSSDQARAWLESKGIPITAEALTDALPFFILLSDNFDKHIK